MDIVRFAVQPDGKEGAQKALSASSLSGFCSVKAQADSKQACRKKGALVHIASYELGEGDLLELARAGGAVVFALSDVIAERGFRRSILVSKMRLLLLACRRQGAPFCFCTLAEDEYGLRSARELTSFAAVIGATDVERKEAAKRLESISSYAKGRGQS